MQKLQGKNTQKSKIQVKVGPKACKYHTNWALEQEAAEAKKHGFLIEKAEENDPQETPKYEAERHRAGPNASVGLCERHKEVSRVLRRCRFPCYLQCFLTGA